MARTVVAVLVLVMGCAAQQRPASDDINGWTPVQQAELHGRCVGGWLAHHVEAAVADALCTCVTPMFARKFSYSWLADGRQIKPEEAQAIHEMQRSCVKELAMARPQPDPRSPGNAPDGESRSIRDEGTGSGGDL